MRPDIDARTIAVGEDPEATRSALQLAGYFFVGFTLFWLFTHGLTEFSAEVTENFPAFYDYLIPGWVLAVTLVFYDTGLLGSLGLTAAPVAGPLFFRGVLSWPDPLIAPESFVYSAATFWILTVLVLGTLAYAVGLVARWIDDPYGFQENV